MSLRRAVLLALAALAAYGGAASGCRGDGSPPSPESDGLPPLLELRLRVPVQLDGIEVEWLRLEDSRCPVGVNCGWAGEARVTLAVREPGAEPREVELGLPPRPEDLPVQVGRYGLELVAVEPYPVHPVEVDDDERLARVRLRPLPAAG